MASDTGIAMITATKTKAKVVTPVKEEVESIPAPAPSSPTDRFIAEVTYSGGVTLNMGNYESGRVDVSLRLPSAFNPTAIERTYQMARSWVQERLAQEVVALEKDRADR